MTSKTSLPIARLRSLGCRVSTLLGHWPGAPVTPEWRYVITLPKGIALPDMPQRPKATVTGYGTAYAHTDGRIIVEAFVNVERRTDKPRKQANLDRRTAETQVAGLLNSIADTLSKAGRS